MVDDEFAVSGPEDDDVLMYLDSGCNSTCHGQYWMEKFEDATNYRPQWMSRERKNLIGIGGAALSLGIRKLYIALETLEGYNVPGIITSIEIEGSHAPLLLSLQAQQDLGMVIDLVEGTVKSRTLGCTFNAVRGRRNRLIGLRLTPGDFMDDGATIPVSLMAEADDGDRGDRDRDQWRRHAKTLMTHEVKKLPMKKKRHRGHQQCVRRGSRQDSARGSADPPSFETYNGLEDWTEDDVFPPAPQPLPETEDDEFVYVEVDVTDDEDDDVIITEDNRRMPSPKRKRTRSVEMSRLRTSSMSSRRCLTRSSTHSRMSSSCPEVETEMDRRRALRLSNTLKRTRQTAGS